MSRSRALCIGINYGKTANALQGCVNDANNLSKLLDGSGAVAMEDITVLCEPTGEELCNAISHLADLSVSQNLNYVFISYSGHGTQVKDVTGDEADGRDEAICPSDFNIKGVITDDLLKSLLQRFNIATTVCFLADACHSGSLLDMNRQYTSKICTLSGDAELPGKIAYISGCRDPQTSADAYDQDSRTYQGVMTCARIKSQKINPATRTDVFKLVAEMRKLLRAQGYAQIPVLTASFDIPRAFSFIPYK
ncbi:peptidase C14, caspase domain-containing protein [Tribonema minus]|uniref:Peptidase C14, caspase domain-containing protein n=1 Tax=Tribonema minus TaxID=303371 RepID=A0A835ZCN1_9STRA|nr:peptidase C14, caspase domain-containing protein [Tribonema minus]